MTMDDAISLLRAWAFHSRAKISQADFSEALDVALPTLLGPAGQDKPSPQGMDTGMARMIVDINLLKMTTVPQLDALGWGVVKHALMIMMTDHARLQSAEAEHDEAFKIRWDADMRAIRRWQAEDHPARELTWPDHADLVVWLLSEIERKDAALAPFARFAGIIHASMNDEVDMTRGSPLAAKQVTVGEFRAALAASKPRTVEAEIATAQTRPSAPANCTHVLRKQGVGYPRTCNRCGLGPCPFFNNDGTELTDGRG